MSEKTSALVWPNCAPERCPRGKHSGSGSALLSNPADVPLILDALLGLVRASGFGERDLFGIRLALEEAIRQGFQHQAGHSILGGLRLRYHLGCDGLLLEVEDEKAPTAATNRCCEQSVKMMRNFMTEVRLHEQGRGVTLYKVRPTQSTSSMTKRL